MVEVKLTKDLVRVVIRGADRVWDVEEYLLEDLRFPTSRVGDSMTLSGVKLTETAHGVLLDPGDHFLFVRPKSSLRLAWGGSVLLTYDEFGKADFVLVGSENHEAAA